MAITKAIVHNGIKHDPCERLTSDLTDQEHAFLMLVRRRLIEARHAKVTGDLNFKAILVDGGITKKIFNPSVWER